MNDSSKGEGSSDECKGNCNNNKCSKFLEECELTDGKKDSATHRSNKTTQYADPHLSVSLSHPVSSISFS